MPLRGMRGGLQNVALAIGLFRISLLWTRLGITFPEGVEAAAALAEHWAPTSASGPEPSAVAVENLLRHYPPWEHFDDMG